MAVYVDNAMIAWRGRCWCHLVADTITELHEFAGKLGLKKAWFQHSASFPHYDVTVEVKAVALELGALPGNRIEIITCARKLKIELMQLRSDSERQLPLFQ